MLGDPYTTGARPRSAANNDGEAFSDSPAGNLVQNTPLRL